VSSDDDVVGEDQASLFAEFGEGQAVESVFLEPSEVALVTITIPP
jgi:hypothetical protein